MIGIGILLGQQLRVVAGGRGLSAETPGNVNLDRVKNERCALDNRRFSPPCGICMGTSKRSRYIQREF
jgi:hypothetical protein